MYVYKAFIYTLRYLSSTKQYEIGPRLLYRMITVNTPILRISTLLLVQPRPKAFQLTLDEP